MSKHSLRIATGVAAIALGTALLAPATAAPIVRVGGYPTLAAQRQSLPLWLSPDVRFTFTTLDDQADPTFNQLLGINNEGEIAGYFGIGSAAHPNRGYTLVPPYGQGNYTNENFPGAAQTQVVGLNNKHDTCGFWIDAKGINRGFVEWNGVFTSYKDPNTGKGTVNQLLAINDGGIAVGFYTDGNGKNHGYTLNQATGVFAEIRTPGGNNVTAAGINNHGDVVGFFTSKSTGAVVGFLLKNGIFTEFVYPNTTITTPFGINDKDQIVGSYVDGAGAMHGFLLSNPLTHAHFQTVDDPNGIGTTVINGINDHTDLVGFYVDGAGNTDGMLATPR